MALKIILTDLDGVLRHFPSQRDGAIETRLGMPIGAIARTAFGDDLLQKVITGKIADDAWRSEIRSRLAKEFGAGLAQEAESQWSESAGELDRDVLTALLKAKSDAQLALLTNATDRLRLDLSRLGIWNLFDRIFNSSEIGYAKPDPKIFEYVIRELGCAPGEILFIDDSKTNAVAAEALGFRTLHFQKGVTSLDREIMALGGN